ncbi:MAG: efflux RND transporter periplasmic adaptor subunit, partial [Ruminococcus sp.]|nr:efflux RND transporter periplasmic adaptor subunit [Ruminococcus sp.]
HLIVEPDMGMVESDVEKKGIWLYSDFVFEEEGKNYVWAANEKDRLEKREVKLGKSDEEMGDVEIVEGLDKKDFIAYPDDQYEEGMKITKDYEKATVPENENADGGEDIDEDIDGEFYDEELDGDFEYDEELDEELYEDDMDAAEVIGEDD